MKHLRLFILSVAFATTTAFVIQSVNWKVKDDYLVQFQFGKLTFGKDSMKAPTGTLTGLKANIVFDEAHPENSKITASVNANSVNTGKPMKDASATGKDVLDADKFPIISFESVSIVKTSSGYEATGKLTLKDVTKEIKMPFVFEDQTFKGGFIIETKDYNFTHPYLPKEISIFMTVPVTK